MQIARTRKSKSAIVCLQSGWITPWFKMTGFAHQRLSFYQTVSLSLRRVTFKQLLSNSAPHDFQITLHIILPKATSVSGSGSYNHWRIASWWPLCHSTSVTDTLHIAYSFWYIFLYRSCQWNDSLCHNSRKALRQFLVWYLNIQISFAYDFQLFCNWANIFSKVGEDSFTAILRIARQNKFLSNQKSSFRSESTSPFSAIKP